MAVSVTTGRAATPGNPLAAFYTTIRDENGGEKVGHGSGGVILLRAA